MDLLSPPYSDAHPYDTAISHLGAPGSESGRPSDEAESKVPSMVEASPQAMARVFDRGNLDVEAALEGCLVRGRDDIWLFFHVCRDGDFLVNYQIDVMLSGEAVEKRW